MSENSRINPQPVDAEEAYYRRTARNQDLTMDRVYPRQPGNDRTPRGRTARKGANTDQN